LAYLRPEQNSTALTEARAAPIRSLNLNLNKSTTFHVVVGVRSTGQIDILYFRRYPGMNYDSHPHPKPIEHPGDEGCRIRELTAATRCSGCNL
jgi:hypothetical protein